MPKRNGGGGDLWAKLFEQIAGTRRAVSQLDKGLGAMGRLVLRIRVEHRGELAEIKRRLADLERAQDRH